MEISPRDRRRFKKLVEESKSFESLPLRPPAAGPRLQLDRNERRNAARPRPPARRRRSALAGNHVVVGEDDVAADQLRRLHREAVDAMEAIFAGKREVAA